MEANPPSISISDGLQEISEIHYQERNLGDEHLFFLVNHSQEQTHEAIISFKGNGSVKKYDAEYNQTTALPCWHEGEYTKVKLSFLPMQSHILTLDLKDFEKSFIPQQETINLSADNDWNISQCDLNALTLDYCHYQINNEEWVGPEPVINLMNKLLKLKTSCDIALRFNFHIEMDLSKNQSFNLVVETPNEFKMQINENTIAYTDQGWWKDSSFRKIDIKPYIKNGANEIILKRNFRQSQKVYDVLFGENVLETEKNKLTYDVELESIYLTGDFGVFSKSEYTYGERKALFSEGPFVINKLPTKVQKGDLTQQGFCFFAGCMVLSQEISITKQADKRYILQLDKPNVSLLQVMVNHQKVRYIAWAPYTVDVTDYIQDGVNTITLQLFSSNRNLLGPHHHIKGQLHFVGPSSFTGQPGWADSGLSKIWEDRYCFVKFGL